MTEIQKIELEMLKEFIRICDELNLTYYLVCGSALGAVKYQGFIPWDDDMDVALPRTDYNIFCEQAQDMLPNHIFLQNHKTDKDYPRIYSKLRNSNTTYIEKTTSNLAMNHGVYIDVFSLDGYPEKLWEIKYLEFVKKKIKLQVECALNVDYGFLRNSFFKIERMIGYHRNTARLIEKLIKYVSKWGTENSVIWCNHGNWQGKIEYARSDQYGHGTWTFFEGIKVRIPEKYDEYLTQKYGDWRAELPKEQQVGHHYYTVCDLEKSYIEYIDMKQ